MKLSNKHPSNLALFLIRTDRVPCCTFFKINTFQGYLSANRFGTFLGLAHAAMTAEGDNSVLMQKVAKERLGELMKSKPKLPEIAADKKQFSNREFLHYLLETRELKLFGELGLKMAKAGKDGTFNTWMLEESDLIQGAARAYGDNLIATRCGFFQITEKGHSYTTLTL